MAGVKGHLEVVEVGVVRAVVTVGRRAWLTSPHIPLCSQKSLPVSPHVVGSGLVTCWQGSRPPGTLLGPCTNLASQLEVACARFCPAPSSLPSCSSFQLTLALEAALVQPRDCLPVLSPWPESAGDKVEAPTWLLWPTLLLHQGWLEQRLWGQRQHWPCTGPCPGLAA